MALLVGGAALFSAVSWRFLLNHKSVSNLGLLWVSATIALLWLGSGDSLRSYIAV